MSMNKFMYKGKHMPMYAVEMFLYDMEEIDEALRSLIRDSHRKEIELTKDVVSRIRGMIQVFDHYN